MLLRQYASEFSVRENALSNGSETLNTSGGNVGNDVLNIEHQDNDNSFVYPYITDVPLPDPFYYLQDGEQDVCVVNDVLYIKHGTQWIAFNDPDIETKLNGSHITQTQTVKRKD